MKITFSRHSNDWVKLSYDLMKVIVSLVVLGPIVTQRAVSAAYLILGFLGSLVFFVIAVYLRERG